MGDALPDQSASAEHWIATAPAGANVLVMQHVTFNATVTQAYRDKGWKIEGPFAAAAERDRLRAENEALREAVARHANEIDPKVLAMVEIPAEHRDAIDNKMYNAVRALDPQWWDKKVPGLNAIFGAGASDEKGHADAS
jgi:hypothetical protein